MVRHFFVISVLISLIAVDRAVSNTPSSFGETDLLEQSCLNEVFRNVQESQEDRQEVVDFLWKLNDIFSGKVDQITDRWNFVPNIIVDHFALRYDYKTTLRLLGYIRLELATFGVKIESLQPYYLPGPGTSPHALWNHVFHSVSNLGDREILGMIAILHADMILAGSKDNAFRSLAADCVDSLTSMIRETSGFFRTPQEVQVLRSAFTPLDLPTAVQKVDVTKVFSGDSEFARQISGLMTIDFVPRRVDSDQLARLAHYYAQATNGNHALAKEIITLASELRKRESSKSTVIAVSDLPDHDSSPMDFWSAAFAEAGLHGRAMVIALLRFLPHPDRVPHDLQLYIHDLVTELRT